MSAIAAERLGSPDSARLALVAWLDESWDPELPLLAWWETLAASGWAAPSWPRPAGGLGLGGWAGSMAADEMRRRRIPGPPGGHGLNMAGPVIIKHGTEHQIQRHVPPVLAGRAVWCQLFSEPDAGSDLAALRTSAVQGEDGGFIVRGQKVWSSHAHHADWGMLLARTGAGSRGREGISWFALRMVQPGVEVRPLRQMNGRAEFNEVFLDGAVAQPADLIGPLHKGWSVARSTLAFERANLTNRTAAVSITRADAEELRAGEALDAAARVGAAAVRVRGARWLMEEARQLGLAGDDSVRQDLARLYTLNEIQRLTGIRSGAGGDDAAQVSSTMKLSASRAITFSADLGMRLQGAAAMLDESAAPRGGQAQRQALWAPAVSIAGGTDEIQRNVIAERVLGMPRDPVAPYSTTSGHRPDHEVDE